MVGRGPLEPVVEGSNPSTGSNWSNDMSVTRQVTVWCDRCSDWVQDSVSVRQLRRKLKTRGWIYCKGGKDFCSVCAVAVKNNARVAERNTQGV